MQYARITIGQLLLEKVVRRSTGGCKGKPKEGRRVANGNGPEGKPDFVQAGLDLAEALRQGDSAGIAAATHPDFMFIDETGEVLKRDAALKGAATKSRSERTNWTVRDYGTVAMIIGRGPAEKGELVTMNVFVKDGEKWQVLVHHLNLVADPANLPPHPKPVPREASAKPPECLNPLKSVPYEPKVQAERDIINSFQVMETAVTHNNPEEWVKHMADEFMVFRTRQRPTLKMERAGHLGDQRMVNAETWVAAVEWMNLWVFGDAAVMRADHRMPGDRRPPYRATRVWVKRDGRWQMATSQQTTRAG